MHAIHVAIVSWALLAPASAVAAQAPTGPRPCAGEPALAWLDFWLGSWDVFVQDTQVGSNEIRKILDDCAVTEDWTSARGQRGFSLFYFQPVDRIWKQVWVTDGALGPNGVKEKALVERSPDGGLRFQGQGVLPGGGTFLDRTTLTPVGPDEVRQLIEVSSDGGDTWQPVFDARYLRRKQP